MKSIKSILEMRDITPEKGGVTDDAATLKKLNKTAVVHTAVHSEVVTTIETDGHPDEGAPEPDLHTVVKNILGEKTKMMEARSLVGSAAPKKPEERHHIFKKDETGEWAHHWIAPSKPDADDEMAALKHHGIEAVKFMTKKSDDAWIKTDAHSYVMARLNTPVPDRDERRGLSKRRSPRKVTPPAAPDLHSSLKLAHQSGKSLKLYYSDGTHVLVDPESAKSILAKNSRTKINSVKKDKDLLDLVCTAWNC